MPVLAGDILRRPGFVKTRCGRRAGGLADDRSAGALEGAGAMVSSGPADSPARRPGDARRPTPVETGSGEPLPGSALDDRMVGLFVVRRFGEVDQRLLDIDAVFGVCRAIRRFGEVDQRLLNACAASGIRRVVN